jgi:geranylgeranyl pyrophosphate synthase
MNEMKEEFETFLEDYKQYSEIFKGGKRIRPIINSKLYKSYMENQSSFI